MLTLNLDDAQARLREIVAGLQPGEEIVLTDNGQPLAILVKTEQTSWPCEPGSAKDTVHRMAPDFDTIPEGFEEYL
jgi:antitoxin (DNA-binding transcriptional repressor) of toxin-antitoxin stability system